MSQFNISNRCKIRTRAIYYHQVNLHLCNHLPPFADILLTLPSSIEPLLRRQMLLMLHLWNLRLLRHRGSLLLRDLRLWLLLLLLRHLRLYWWRLLCLILILYLLWYCHVSIILCRHSPLHLCKIVLVVNDPTCTYAQWCI